MRAWLTKIIHIFTPIHILKLILGFSQGFSYYFRNIFELLGKDGTGWKATGSYGFKDDGPSPAANGDTWLYGNGGVKTH